MPRREKRSEGAWEQSEKRKDPVVNRVGRGGTSVWLLLVLSSWWGNMSLTPPLLLCTENITANMSVVETGGENSIWKMYIMDSCAVWRRSLLFVSALRAWIYRAPYITYVCTHAAVMEIMSVNVFVSVYAIKYGRGSSPNYDSDVSLEFWEQAVHRSTSNAFSSHTNPASRWQIRKLCHITNI